MDYIEKLKESIGVDELKSLFSTAVIDNVEFPHFVFGDVKLYPKSDINATLESSYTGSTTNNRVMELEELLENAMSENSSLSLEKRNTKAEIDGYIAEIERLEEENKSLKAKTYVKRGRPPKTASAFPPQFDDKMKLIESEWFTGEMANGTITALRSWMENHKPQTPTESNRAYDLIRKYVLFIEEKIGDMASKEAKSFKKEIEDAIDKVYDSSPTDISPLLKIGFIDCTDKRAPHWKVCYRGDEHYTFIIAKTPGSPTTRENCKKEFTRRLCI